MVNLVPFSQSDHLRTRSRDEMTRHGVCAGLCDDWLALITGNYPPTPERRMQRLAATFDSSMMQQRALWSLYRTYGREEGHRRAGVRRGVDYDFDKTQINRSVGGGTIERSLPEFWNTIQKDIASVTSGAAWSLRLSDGRRHAIAGYCGYRRIAVGLQLTTHIFDPNIGEYAGDFGCLNEVLSDMRTRIPLYRTVNRIERRGAQASN